MVIKEKGYKKDLQSEYGGVGIISDSKKSTQSKKKKHTRSRKNREKEESPAPVNSQRKQAKPAEHE
jgi:hypothetical protein